MSQARNAIKSREVHELLSDVYSGYRGVNAPVNTQTENLWAEIERLEREEGVVG